MSQKYPVQPARRIGHRQQPESSLPLVSWIHKRYVVEIFACALLSASPSVAGNTQIAESIRQQATAANHVLGKPSTETLCKPGCITVIDYLNTTTHLEFSRSYNTARSTHADVPARWRHRYEIRLTRQGNDRVVFDHHGNRHLFISNHDGTYTPADSASGTLLMQAGQPVWTDRQATQHSFHGSFLTTLRFADNQTLTLHYESGQLRSVTDETLEKIEWIHDNDSLSKIQLPDRRAVHTNSDPCDSLPQSTTDPLPGDSTPPERCDTQENPVPGFDAINTRPGVLTLDARPASCQSYFIEFYGTVRGEEIEAGLEDHPPYSAMVPTSRTFPVIDFINGNELIVVRSRDVASPSFNNPDSPDALYDRLMRDGRQIQRRALDRLESEGVLSGSANGRTTLITHSEQQSVTLHVLIRQGMASAAHWQQIENARAALALRYGIQLQVVIIP